MDTHNIYTSVGGAQSEMDAFELILCGAKTVQIGTLHGKEEAGCFDRVANELEEIMTRKRYSSIDGKLKPFQKAPKTKVKFKTSKNDLKSISASSDSDFFYFCSFSFNCDCGYDVRKILDSLA